MKLIIMNNLTLESEVAATLKNTNVGILVTSNWKQQYFYKSRWRSVRPIDQRECVMHVLFKRFKNFLAITLGACFIAYSGLSLAENPTVRGKPVEFVQRGEVTDYATWSIPQHVVPNPNLATLRHYLKKYLRDSDGFDAYVVKAAETPSELKFDVKKNNLLSQQMQSSSILSYLYYADDTILHDERTSETRFGDLYSDDTSFISNSVGKSMVSYVLGHAICEGYIDSVESTIADWPLMAGTLYHNQRIIDLLNMKAQDEKYVHDSKGLLSSGRWYNVHPLVSFANIELKGSAPSGNRSYHYNGLVTNVLANYAIFKSGNNYQELLDKIFREKAGVKHDVIFYKIRSKTKDAASSWYQFKASRYDYLRIARAMLADWKADTCVGKYLKNVYEKRQAKLDIDEKNPDMRSQIQSPRGYGGQFHTDYIGMVSRKIFGLDGYGGQSILVDTENSRIVVVNSIHNDYNWFELVHQVIKNGKIKD